MFKHNSRTQLLLDTLEDIIQIGERENKKYVIAAGLGIDIEAAALRGDHHLTRDHHDIDVHPLEEDIPFWKDWFAKQGYLVSKNDEIKDPDKAFVAYSPDFIFKGDPEESQYYIDVYGLYIDSDGFIHSRETGQDDPWHMKWDDAFKKVTWRDHTIWVMKHEVALKNKRETAKAMGNPLREKDIHDHTLFGVEL